MLFNIFSHDLLVLILLFLTFSIVLFKLFSPYISSILDPIVLHIFWLVSTASLLCAILIQKTTDINTISFIIGLLAYILVALFFLRRFHCRKSNLIKASKSFSNSDFISLGHLSNKSYALITLTLFLCYLYANLDLFKYISQISSFNEIYLYRFVQLQGRDPLRRIIEAGTSSYFSFFLIGGLFRRDKRIALTLLIFKTLLGTFSGGRSTLLGVFFEFGSYCFFYKDFIDLKLFKFINKIGFAAIFASLLLASYVSSKFMIDGNLVYGLLNIFERIFAAADGLQHYIYNSGDVKLDSGINSFFMSVFGIYVKNLVGNVEYKNVGWQLSELALGSELSFAQGANYTFLLQGAILSPVLIPLYPILSAFLMAKMRNIWISKRIYHPLYFYISASAFQLVGDLELFIFYFISSITCFFLIIMPFQLRFRTRAISFSRETENDSVVDSY